MKRSTLNQKARYAVHARGNTTLGRLVREFHRDRYGTVQDCNRLLIAHIDDVVLPQPPHSRERMITRLLLERGLLFENRFGQTKMTVLGREALAALLAEMADVLLDSYLAQEERINRRAALRVAFKDEPREIPEPEHLDETVEFAL